jgi:hypothetical protein
MMIPGFNLKYLSRPFQLMQAMALFSLQARGPASASFAEKLAAECTSYWQSGRQVS